MNTTTTHQHKLTEFAFNGLKLRALNIDGNPWFIAADVCRCLGLTTRNGALNKLNADEKSYAERFRLGLNAGKPMWLISESGLYKLVLRAHRSNPAASSFQDWVTREVLPAIRKDGSYILGEEKVRTGEMTEDELILRAHEALKRKVERLQQENAVMSDELNLITVDEFRSLKHTYWSRSTTQQLGLRATRLARKKHITLTRQPRQLISREGTTDCHVNVYPRHLLEEALKHLQAEAQALLKTPAAA